MRTMSHRSSDAPATDDAGFTLVEVIVAMFITVTVMLSLTYATVGSLKSIQQARQRQTATALATQQLERLRALPYDTVTQPDGSTGVKSGLQYVSTSGGSSTFAPAASLLPGVSEPLVVNTVSGQWTDTVVDHVTYRVQTYVTKAAATASGSQSFNLTAIVRWTSSVWPGGRETIQRSTTFSPAGCLSTATSPFAAPCQAYYTVRAGEALSGLTITDPVDSSQTMLGLSASKLQLDLGSTSTNLLVEQVAKGTAGASTSGAAMESPGISKTGGEAADVAVDSDPSSVPGQSLSVGTPAHSSGTLTTGGSGGTLTLRPSSADSGSAAAAISADGTICTGANGSPLTTGVSGLLRPCSSANMQTAGSSSVLTYISPGGNAIDIATLGTAGAPSRAVAAVLSGTNAGICSAGGVVDCGHAASARSIGAAGFGTSPFGSAPSGFQANRGLWSLSGLTETASAEEGKGALAPSFSRSGTLSIWNGSGYDTVNLASYASPATASLPGSELWVIPATTVDYGDVEIDYEGSVTVQRPRITRTPATRTGVVATDCKTDACASVVDASGAVTARVVVTVRSGGTVLTTFAAVTDLGGLTANASYKAAANA